MAAIPLTSKFALALSLVLILCRTVPSAELPGTMIHAVVAMSGTDIAADSFFTKPKTFWRASNQYCRIDEEPDAAKGIHGKIVISEPDVWMINLADHTGRHLVDRGPTFNCKLPIFALDREMATGKIGELEIGHELEFFQANNAKLIEGPKLSFETRSYELTLGDATFVLVERADIHAPILISLKRGDKSYQSRYRLWEQIPFQADLFAKPSGVILEEAK